MSDPVELAAREADRLRSELRRATELLEAERAEFAREMALGARELTGQDERIVQLTEQVAGLTEEIARLGTVYRRVRRQRNKARRDAALLRDSRLVRLAARIATRGRWSGRSEPSERPR